MTHANFPESFGADPFLYEEVMALIGHHGIKSIVETGCGLGATTRALAAVGVKLLAVDMLRTATDQTKALLRELLHDRSAGQGLLIVNGESPDALRGILADLARPVLFYLDASGVGNLPLLDELRQIAFHGFDDSVIVIPGCHNPNRPEMAATTYDEGKPIDFNYCKQELGYVYGGQNRFHYYYNSEAQGVARGVLFVIPREARRDLGD